LALVRTLTALGALLTRVVDRLDAHSKSVRYSLMGHGGALGALPLLVFVAASAAAQHVRIRVTDDVDEAPIPNAVISLLNDGKSVRADDAGVILVAVAHAGPNVFTIRRLGYRPITTTFDVPAHDTLKVHVIMSATPAALDTVSVTARSMTSQFSAFEARRLRNSGGHFVTREQIDSQRPIETVDLLRSIPGFRVVRPSNGGDPLIESTRGKTSPGAMGMLGSELQGSVPCHPRIGVDGAVYGVDFPINEIEPLKIYGIEIYDGGATLPPEYITGVAVGGSCGLIMIWTRTGGGEHPKPPPGDGTRLMTYTTRSRITFLDSGRFYVDEARNLVR
jgi:hypothetical protein